MNYRKMCYLCNRPENLCLCSFIKPISTKTKFVILMHPKEFKSIKNNTGRLTHMSLKNSDLFVGINFTNHDKINSLINNPKNYCVVLYPSKQSICLNEEKLNLQSRELVIFIIDATWDSSKPMLRLSENISKLPKISFTQGKVSEYKFKRQPFVEALSTIESTLSILEILKVHGVEELSEKALCEFLNPFKELVKCQMKFINTKPRFKQ